MTNSDIVHIVPCYRIELVPEPPERGVYTREHCCKCNDQIWVSERAQDLRNNNKKVAVMCLWCSALVNGEFEDFADGNYIIIQGLEG